MLPPNTSKADPRLFVILAAFSAPFLAFGVLLLIKQGEWQGLLAIAAILSVFWAGALSVRFRFDDAEIHYRSLFRRLTVPTAQVSGIEIVAERKGKAPQGVPRFYLRLADGKREALNVKVLPIDVIREFCAMLTRHRATVIVQDAMMAKRMASQIFPDERQPV